MSGLKAELPTRIFIEDVKNGKSPLNRLAVTLDLRIDFTKNAAMIKHQFDVDEVPVDVYGHTIPAIFLRSGREIVMFYYESARHEGVMVYPWSHFGWHYGAYGKRRHHTALPLFDIALESNLRLLPIFESEGHFNPYFVLRYGNLSHQYEDGSIKPNAHMWDGQWRNIEQWFVCPTAWALVPSEELLTSEVYALRWENDTQEFHKSHEYDLQRFLMVARWMRQREWTCAKTIEVAHKYHLAIMQNALGALSLLTTHRDDDWNVDKRSRHPLAGNGLFAEENHYFRGEPVTHIVL
jgi:hypothetical protein